MNYKILGLVAIFLSCSPALARDKTDVIHLLNGDRVTGEITQLEHGRLQVKTAAMGTLLVEWDDISTVNSPNGFEFELTNGDKFVSSMEKGAQPGEIKFPDRTHLAAVPSMQVIRITPIENTLWENVSGSLSFGYSFTKASEVSQLNFSTNVTFRSEKRAITLSASSIVTEDQSNDVTDNETLKFNVERFFKHRWFRGVMGGFERNDLMGLNLRTSLGAGIGRRVFQTNTTELTFLGGAIATLETLRDGMDSEKNVEALLGAKYSRYIFDEPNVDISTQLVLYPNLTDRGRIRATLDARMRYELIEDLFLDFSFYDIYDSDPPSGVDITNDYGFVTSVGWSF